MRETKEIQVKYFVSDLEELCCVPGSDWVDLRAAEDLDLKAGEFRLIPLGIAVALPEGYEAHVVPRSSTFKNYGLLQANSMGVVLAIIIAILISSTWSTLPHPAVIPT